MTNIAIITGSTRPGRQSLSVAQWVLGLAQARNDGNTYEVVDIADYNLPIWDEPQSPSFGVYTHEYSQKWAAKISEFDGFVFVTPEYNHAAPASLTNALTYLKHEWANKAAGFVSYGSAGGVRAVENLRVIFGELAIATVRSSPALGLFDDFTNFTTFTPREALHAPLINAMISEVIAWTDALAPLRAKA